MFIGRQIKVSRVALRLMLAVGTAALVAGCSDATRFSSDPFGDPFQRSASTPSRGLDRSPTGSIARPRPTAPQTSAIQSRPLPAPVASAAPAVAPAPAPAPVAAGSFNHWSAEGGTPVVVGQGETAGVIANRYGVPSDALLRVNGFSSASQVKPGSNLVIPVYRAAAAPASAARPAPVARVEEPRAPATEPKKTEARHKPARVEEDAEVEAPAKHEKRVDALPPKKPVLARREKAEDDDEATPVAKAAKAKPARPAEKVAVKSNEDEDEKPAVKAKQKPAKMAKLKEEAEKDDEAPAKPKEKPARLAAHAPVASAPVAQKAEKKLAQQAESRPRAQQPSQREEARAEEKQLAPPPERAQPKIAANDPAPAEKAPERSVDRTPTASIPPASDKAAAADDRPEFRWPAKGRIIQNYANGGNDGINISMPEGTPVKAAEGGVVAYAGNELKGYGNLVLIRHPNGFVSAYAHNGEIDVKRGDKVSRGQMIAKSGQTGNVGSPQLHFELRKGSTPVNPTEYLANLQ